MIRARYSLVYVGHYGDGETFSVTLRMRSVRITDADVRAILTILKENAIYFIEPLQKLHLSLLNYQ